MMPAHDTIGDNPEVRRTLVVVEDDEDVRRALTRLLSLLGYGVRAYDSAEAWPTSTCPADGAIIDINLPGMSGLELDDLLKRQGRAIPTVFITAQDGRGAAAAGRIVLQKPFDMQALLNAIEHAFATRNGSRLAGDSF